MDFSQERKRPLFVERTPEGTRFVSISDIEGGKLAKHIEGSSLASPELKKKFGSLTLYLIKHLGIETLPASLKLINSKKNADNDFGLTGHYDHKTQQITIYITGRSDTDILRSYCHEIVHHWQNDRGVLHPEDKGINMGRGNNADEHYAQDNWWLRKREMEAYLFSGLLLRDWQDLNRYGPPNQEPILPQPYD